jgi:hypothetical protein
MSTFICLISFFQSTDGSGLIAKHISRVTVSSPAAHSRNKSPHNVDIQVLDSMYRKQQMRRGKYEEINRLTMLLPSLPADERQRLGNQLRVQLEGFSKEIEEERSTVKRMIVK